mgnify:CR=1 FL=1
MNEINIEKLRSDLIDYYGTAMSLFPMAIINLNEVYNASDEKLIEIAIKNKFNLENYVNNDYQKKRMY